MTHKYLSRFTVRELVSTALPIVALQITLVLCSTSACAQEAEVSESGLVLEAGPAAEWSLSREQPNFGGSITCELPAIPNWLEFEFGLSAFATSGDPELEAEFLLEKPFQLTPQIEFMLQAGPSISHEFESSNATLLNIEVDAGFFIWPQKNLGWYVETGWSGTPKTGHQSLTTAVGALIPIGGD